MSRTTLLSLVLLLSVAAALTGVEAAGPIFWQVATRADFMKGEVDAVAVDADGRLRIGPAVELVHDAGTPFAWSAARGRDGMLYVGTGNDGRLLRLDARGAASVVFDAAEPEIHAVAAAPDGAIFAATSPDGRIYRIDQKGASRVWFDPPDRYIWALATDGAGALYAATGDQGLIYKVTGEGTGTVLYKTGATHAVALAVDAAGALLAGTDSPGRLLRISADGRPTVLLDTEFREAHAIEVDPKGVIYVAAIDGARGPATADRPETAPEPPKTAPVPTVSTEIVAFAVADLGAAAQGGKATDTAGSASAKGAVFRVQPDGAWDTVWESADDLPFDLCIDTAGRLLVATGNQGRLYRLEGEPMRATLLGRVPAQQATAFAGGENAQPWVLTSNPGKVVRLGSGAGAKGSYESEVRDTRSVSGWGTISWQASVPSGARVELYTRSGNTSRPDETWSPWAGPYADAGGEQIGSPKARYIQWKAVLTGTLEAPALTSATIAYLPRNQRPQVEAITVHPPGLVFQKPYSTGELEIAGFEPSAPDNRPGGLVTLPGVSAMPAVGRRLFQKGLQTFQWKATDADEDTLRFDLLYRLATADSWRTLKGGLADPLFVWDTTSVPNGSYVVRVVASDALSNTPDSARAGDLDSVAFEVDNTPPSIRVTAVRREAKGVVVEFDATDVDSAIQRVDFSLDAAAWTRIHPLDGLADSRRERFRLSVGWDDPGGTLVLRAADALGNLATERVASPPRQK